MHWTDGLTDFSEKKRQKKYTFSDFQRLPTITFLLSNDVELNLKPKYYMEGVPLDSTGEPESWKGSKTLINRVYLEEAEGSVLGANAMFGYDILFDAERHQVGIAAADCHATARSSLTAAYR